jgi:hypothetical protein
MHSVLTGLNRSVIDCQTSLSSMKTLMSLYTGWISGPYLLPDNTVIRLHVLYVTYNNTCIWLD